jgi:hypothetical protein
MPVVSHISSSLMRRSALLFYYDWSIHIYQTISSKRYLKVSPSSTVVSVCIAMSSRPVHINMHYNCGLHYVCTSTCAAPEVVPLMFGFLKRYNQQWLLPFPRRRHLTNDMAWIKILPGGTCPKWRCILWVVIKPSILPWREAFRFQLLLTE